jgi:hypothetical protein
MSMALYGGEMMRYTKINRVEYEGFITIGEYTLKKDPETFKQLQRTYLMKHDIGQYLSKQMDESWPILATFQAKQLMTERPKPGRGGLLPLETEADLWGDKRG